MHGSDPLISSECHAGIEKTGRKCGGDESKGVEKEDEEEEDADDNDDKKKQEAIH